MLEDIQNVFVFLAYLVDVAEHMYTSTGGLFLVSLYLLGVSCLVRLLLGLMTYHDS